MIEQDKQKTKEFIDEYINLCRKHHKVIMAGIEFPHKPYVHVGNVAYTNTEWEEYYNELQVDKFAYLEEDNE